MYRQYHHEKTRSMLMKTSASNISFIKVTENTGPNGKPLYSLYAEGVSDISEAQLQSFIDGITQFVRDKPE